MIDLLIKDAKYLDEKFNVQRGDIAIHKGYYVEYGGEEAKCTVTSDRLWMPGLSDNHIHISQQFLQGKLLFEKPIVWKRINVPFEASLDEEMVKLSTLAAAANMIKNGVTSFVDSGCPKAISMAEVLTEVKVRGSIGYQTTDMTPFETLRTNVKEAVERNDELAESLKGNELINPIFGVTNLVASTRELQEAVLLEGKKRGFITSCHMNEYESEILTVIEKEGVRPFEYLDSMGALHDKFVGAHGLFLSENEKNLIKSYNSKIVHCPYSNSAKGIPETDSLLSRNISVFLGTDGAGHGGLDLFAEVRLFSAMVQLLAKAKGDYALVNSEDILRMAVGTVDEKLGKIKVGYKADLISLDVDDLRYLSGDICKNTIVEVTNGSMVKDSIINGEFVMKDRELLTIDEERLKNTVRSSCH
ncbi:amidohydrolase family protein [Lacrimispora sp.]|uniref:amidohydrolase family protein n=1 Tax=Lacrimispora sp. TaxID=2719234 RepID=UPI00345FC29F